MPGGNMAGTNVGTIYYTVDADTSKLLSSNKAIDSSISGTKNSFKKLDTQVTQTAKAVNTSLSGMGRSAGQVGVQVQQLVGQVQGGQNVFQAFAAQAADIGIVLGAPLVGVIVALGAAVAGTLLPSLFDSKDATEELEKATERLAATFTLSRDGVVQYSESMALLAKASQTMAKVRLENAIDEQVATMKTAAESLSGTITDAIGNDGLVYSAGMENLFGSYSDEAAKLSFEMLGLAKTIESGDYSSDAIDNLATSLEKARKIGLGTTDSGQELITMISELITQIKSGEISIADMQEKLKETEISFDEQGESVDRLRQKYAQLAQSLKVQADTLGMTRSETLSYNKSLALQEAAEVGAEEATLKNIAASYDKQIAYEKDRESLRKSTEQTAKATAAQNKLNSAKRQANSSADKAISYDDTQLDKLEKERQEIESYYNQRLISKQKFDAAMNALNEKQAKIEEEAREKQNNENISRIGQSSDAMSIGIDTESRLQELQALHDAELVSEEEFAAQKLSIMQDCNSQIMALAEERFRQESEGNAFIMDSLDSLSSTATNVFSGMLSGTMSVTDAMASFGNAILNDAIGALVQMGIQQVKNQLISKSAAATDVATAVASGASITAAYAPAATAAAFATSGGSVTAGSAALTNATPLMNGLLGMAHDGISEVPTEGTWLLNKGERVYTNDSAQKLDQMYNKVMLSNPVASYTPGNTSNNSQVVNNSNITINIASDGSTSSSVTGDPVITEETLKQLGTYVEVKFKQLQAQSMKQGGSLWKANQRR